MDPSTVKLNDEEGAVVKSPIDVDIEEAVKI